MAGGHGRSGLGNEYGGQLGLPLYRSTDGTWSTAEQVTEQLILAQGRGQGGASYQWADEAVTPGTRYTYWLVEPPIAMVRPKRKSTPSTTDYQVFLPFVRR